MADDDVDKNLKLIKALCVSCDTTNTCEVNSILCDIIDLCNEMLDK